MTVEVIGDKTGERMFRRVARLLTAAVGAPTVGMVLLWPYNEAHRSVPSFVVTCLWTATSIVLTSMVIAGPDVDTKGAR